ncbi:uncharacterized protein SPPG_07285 [Spizellomyces punctatus DAOM BR117]|uniref:CHHC U11-48K-type domain-containing protein n=1 Tax=Spizellomyces punctatus (strain DAOM BR117) TaxID=645134 RepID=A0A0L0H7Z8_SPIPD|nr:uncharacterized protein SPPG_07285 [Spizellomyces punctatus DAOM BR117]KNC97357.1 hypothetical protein SPPG_07285 [Spizellomyces punctatus DAOM BR117]|eukprot:XP_016605397.1 hypothetical protein SPPG_07285 [Spizellomyces punctatus DAOM BR117]
MSTDLPGSFMPASDSSVTLLGNTPLDSIRSELHSAHETLVDIVTSLGCSFDQIEEYTTRSKHLVSCPYVLSHRVPQKFLERHVERCKAKPSDRVSEHNTDLRRVEDAAQTGLGNPKRSYDQLGEPSTPLVGQRQSEDSTAIQQPLTRYLPKHLQGDPIKRRRKAYRTKGRNKRSLREIMRDVIDGYMADIANDDEKSQPNRT